MYGLIDPRQPTAIRYVGYTSKTLAQRLYRHKSRVGLTASTRAARETRFNLKDRWISSMLAEGAQPQIISLVESLPDVDAAVLIEAAEIVRLGTGTAGHDLLNATNGGERRVSFRQQPATVDRVAEKLRGRHISEEHRASIAASNRARGVSDETREKQRLSHLGRSLSEAHKQKLRKASTGRRHSDEDKQKMRESIAARSLRYCEECTFSTKNGGAMASHQRSSGHEGWSDVQKSSREGSSPLTF